MAAAVGWAAALPLATWSASRPAAWSLSALAFVVYAVGGLICHQLPERSFHLWSVQMPVCARCTSIYVGGAIASLVRYAASGFPPRFRWGHALDFARGRPSADLAAGSRPSSRTRVRLPAPRRILLLAALPTAATLLVEWTTGQMPANWIRALAGFPIGAAVVWVIVEAPAAMRESK
jgi:hypothetical protein